MGTLRWNPPPLQDGVALRWVLRAAFGAEPPDGGRAEPGEVERVALALDLVPRIAARLGRARLEREVGADAAGRFIALSRAAAAVALRVETVVHHLAGVAVGHALPLTFLKFAALHLSGRLTPASRMSADLDVLAPASRARDLRAWLLDSGFADTSEPEYEHQLPGLLHPSGLVVEIHTCILGVRLGGARSTDHSGLLESGHLVRVADLPPELTVPERDVLAAHALVHGIAQHGSVPGSYPGFRMLADIADLQAGGSRDRWGPWIARDVTRAEVDAVLALAGVLDRGDLPGGGSPASRLLAHLVGGALDAEYAASLRLGGVFHEVTDRWRVTNLLVAGWKAAFPAEAKLDGLYGPAPSFARRLGRRAFRPVDVAMQLARHIANATRRSGPPPAAVTSPRSPGRPL